MRTHRGLGVSPGIAIGPAFVVPRSGEVPDVRIDPSQAESELLRFRSAVATVVRSLEDLSTRLVDRGSADEAGILEAQSLIAADPTLAASVEELVRDGRTCEPAVVTAIAGAAALLASAESELMRARAADVQDVGQQLLRALAGGSVALEVTPGSVVVAWDLVPSEIARFESGKVAGVAIECGGSTSHVAILARALGIPTVVGLGASVGLTRLVSGTLVGLDGSDGTLVIEPDPARLSLFRKKAAADRALDQDLPQLIGLPACTRDEVTIALSANIGRMEDVQKAAEVGAEGAGLVRTELFYIDSQTEPDEDAQAMLLGEIMSKLAPHRTVVRTFDIGADKPVPYLPQEPEPNPFLGMRGIRLALAYPDALRRQLRAVLRASASGRGAIMYPFVAHRDEIIAANEELEHAEWELRAAGIEVPRIERGAMVEIPSLALVIDGILDHVDFVSVGTNDLVQYVFAADRTNAATATIGDAAHPAMLRLMGEIVGHAHARGRWVGVCGEAAADPAIAVLLLGLGVDELSVAPAALLRVKATIRSVRASAAQDLARSALTSTADAADVRQNVGAFMDEEVGSR